MRRTTVPWMLGLLACGGAEIAHEPSTSAGGEGVEAPGPRVVGLEVSYQAGDTTLRGYLAWDEARPGKRPGVIVVHEWWGHNEYVRKRARMLAELGYTALAIDMYGDGKNTQHPADAQAFAQAATADAGVAAARFTAGMQALAQHETTDAERVAAIGYCFGGSVVLNMVRAGVDLDAVASFHGTLGAATPARAGAILGNVWVFTGEADPMVPTEQVDAFRREMEQAGAHYSVVSYPGVVHSFTNPGATEIGKAHGLPIAYDATADADSWSKLVELLQTTFAARTPSAEEREKARAAATARGDFARMEAEAEKEGARWTDALRAQAKALAETAFPNTRAALRRILASPHRAPSNPERDGARHPVETLSFLGIRPEMTVFEYGPGGGWYTEILAPLLAKRGKLIVNNGNPDGSREERATYYAKRFALFLARAPEIYGKVEVVRVDDVTAPALGLAGVLDAALVIRGYHGWKNRGATGAWLAQIHTALKPKGVLGIVQHRADEGADPKASAEKGRLPEKALIDEVEAAGFELVAKSEINANPKDKRDQPEGVWVLPPTLRLGDVDREKYLAIGESDRMTLKFVRVQKPAE